MFVGAKGYFNDSVAGTKATAKAARAMVHAIKLVNTTAAAAYLQMFDKAAADVTVGTTPADFTIPLAASESLTLPLHLPLEFVLGIVLAGTTTAGGSTGAAIKVFLAIE